MPISPGDFRKIALSLAKTIESSHLGQPDFRVGGRIFATLAPPDKGWGVVKLSPDMQEMLLATEPEMFAPEPGTWGRRGWTRVHLARADKAAARSALTAAWRNTAPKRLVKD